MTEPRKNDAAILAKLFFPEGHDPAQAVAVFDQDSVHPFAVPTDASVLLAFGKKPDLPQFHCRSFDYVNNADGSIRWLWPTNLQSPIFLKLYNGAGLRGRVFRLVFRTAFFLGQKHRVKSGSVHVFSKKSTWLDQLTARFETNDYAIFTGTVGENRKVVIALQQGKTRGGWFCKLPLTESATALVAQERNVLEELKQFNFEKLEVPKAEALGNCLSVSDVKPTRSRSGSTLQPAHFEALEELKRHTVQEQPLGSLPMWSESGQYLSELEHQAICNDLPERTVNQVIGQLKALRSSFNASLSVPTSLAHGDFTPWNMYLSDKKLHVYDWELAGRQPLLFDAFHFVFQSGVLLRREPFPQIKKRLKAMEGNSVVKAMLLEQKMGFQELYHLYVLQNTSYYLLRYLRQQPLHVQAHWLLEVWNEALNDDWCSGAKYPSRRKAEVCASPNWTAEGLGFTQ